MLRRISTAVATAAMLGLCALPASASTAAAHHPASGTFTIPSANSAVKAWGSYSRYSASIIKVTVCVEQTGSAYAVGAEANAYNDHGQTALADEIGAVILPGAAHKACGTRYLRYLAHLKVHSFIGGSAGRIIKTSSVKTVY
jgi:hypothetical protein